MPKQTPTVPNDLLLAKLGDREALSDELWLVSSQVGMLLGRSLDQLDEDRKAGVPPPFIPLGPKSVRYKLGSVRDHMLNRQEYSNTTEARLASKSALLSFSSWMDTALPSDERPFLIRRNGGPVDFWRSLSMGESLEGDEECVWLSFAEYLARRRDAAMEAERDAVGEAVSEPAAENGKDWKKRV